MNQVEKTDNTSIQGRVSVIIPVYNTEEFLLQCVNSVFDQDEDCVREIILVDDGSTDNSGLTCDELAKHDRRIRVFHIQHAGSSCARNVGLDNAEGDYIFFLDSDDFLDSGTISSLLTTALDTGADITDGKMLLKYADKSVRPFYKEHKSVVLDHDDYLREMLRRDFIGWENAGKLYKASVIQNIRFDEEHIVAEDLLFNWKVADNVKKYCYVPQAIYYYVQHSGSSMHSGISSHVLDSLKVYKVIANDAYERSLGDEGDIIAETMLDYGFSIMQQMIVNGEYEKRVLVGLQEFLIDCIEEFDKVTSTPIYRNVMDNHPVVDIYSIEKTKTNIISLHSEEQDRLTSFFSNNRNVYVYGGGKVAELYLRECKAIGITPIGIIVSNKENVLNSIKEQYEIFQYDTIADQLNGNDGVLIAAGKSATEEIKELLEEKDFHNYIECDAIFTSVFLI